jgi:CBS domain-containing protein
MKPSTNKLHVKVADLMQSPAMNTTPSQTVGRVRKVMREHHISCMPVADAHGHPIGIVTATDLLPPGSDERHVSQVMAKNVQTVPLYADIALAARTMRKHHIHHIVVVEEKKIVGVISSFDVLRIVEEHAFKAVKPPDRPKHRRRSGGKRDVNIHGHTESS